MPSFDIHAIIKQLQYDPANPLLFNNGFFVYLFAVFMTLYYLLRHFDTARRWLFCCFSLYFFYKASGYFVSLVILSAIVNYFISHPIHNHSKKAVRGLVLALGIAFNLFILFYFKYTNFIIDILRHFFSARINPLNILLPVGISFFTFENISYIVDVYKGKFVPVKKFSEYLLFLSFFPKLIMGPIVRASDFIPQISKPYFVSQEDFAEGFFLIITGLFKKLIISDYITINYVDYIFDNPAGYTGLECLFAVYGYAIVIYCDFSGYSNVAIGLARWLGFLIPANFNLPYQSKDVTEFWKRWHISLSSWLRDYLYIPLGGNRKGKVRMYLNLMATMVLGGLWHGASWAFILWGTMHGVALAIHKLWDEKSKYVLAKAKETFIYKGFAIFFTFHFVCLCWIFFKASSFTIALQMLRQIKYNFNGQLWPAFWNNYHNVIWMMLFGYVLHALPGKLSGQITLRLQKLGLAGYVVIFMLFILLYGYFKASDPVMPIYLQF